MIREYQTNDTSDVIFFVGTEIEKTPAFGLTTLFVVGTQSLDKIDQIAKENQCQHVYFGANHCYYKQPFNSRSVCELFQRIKEVIDLGYLVTLDLDSKDAMLFQSTGEEIFQLLRNEKFIPVISVKLLQWDQYGKNAHLKIDDVGFRISNPGVWSHSLDTLLSNETFTPWELYKQDKVIKND